MPLKVELHAPKASQVPSGGARGWKVPMWIYPPPEDIDDTKGKQEIGKERKKDQNGTGANQSCLLKFSTCTLMLQRSTKIPYLGKLAPKITIG